MATNVFRSAFFHARVLHARLGWKTTTTKKKEEKNVRKTHTSGALESFYQLPFSGQVEADWAELAEVSVLRERQEFSVYAGL